MVTIVILLTNSFSSNAKSQAVDSEKFHRLWVKKSLNGGCILFKNNTFLYVIYRTSFLSDT